MVYSYSSIATYKQCPAKFNFAYIEKAEAPDLPPSPAMDRGSKVHDSVENYFKGTNEYLHPDIHANYGQFMMSLREDDAECIPEFKWGVTWEFKPCAYDAPNCMIHGFIDLLYVPKKEDEPLTNYEWKTGKKYIDQHRDQGLKYSIAMMCHYPERPGVESMTTYFDLSDYDKIYYPKTMMFEYRPALRSEIGRIADASSYPPMPSFKCKWCKYSRYNGGPCPVA